MKTEDLFMLEERYFDEIFYELNDLGERINNLYIKMTEKKPKPWEEDIREIVGILKALFNELGYQFPTYDDLPYLHLGLKTKKEESEK